LNPNVESKGVFFTGLKIIAPVRCGSDADWQSAIQQAGSLRYGG